MRIILLLFIFISTLFASNLSKEHILNSIKSLIQKEEILALAINRYILEKAKLPKKDGKFDWNELENGYLVNFDKKSPFLNKDLEVTFDANNNIFIKGIVLTDTDFNTELKYAYNIYTDNIFRVNTIPPVNNSIIDTLKTNLKNGTQVAYSNIQKDIIEKLNNNKLILFSNQECTSNGYFYELRGKELIYKYCKTNINTGKTTHINVYQNSPLYLEDKNDLSIIRGNIGDKAYVKTETGVWEEYYFDSESNSGWISVFTGKSIGNISNTNTDLTGQIISYVPEGKDLFIRSFGGCYLAYGDIFCWGNNLYKKAGIENYGQLDTILKPNYINTPVMLKVAIEDVLASNGSTLKIKELSWYNSIYRIKFEKMGINSKNVCGVSPIFTETKSGNTTKIGGDLYCNGLLDWSIFDKPYDSISSNETSILSKHKFFAQSKGVIDSSKNPIFLTDIAMIEDTTLLLGYSNDVGKKNLYVFGKNIKGALGLNDNNENRTDYFLPKQINTAANSLENIYFKQIVATRDAKMFGALDNDNYFYIWGETPKGVLYKPTKINNTKYQEDIQIQSRTFILKEAIGDGKFVYINSENNVSNFTKESADEIDVVAYYNYNESIQTPYINQNKKLKEPSSQNNYLECKLANNSNCSSEEDKLFKDSLDYLNSLQSSVNSDGDEITSASFTNIGVFTSIHQTNYNSKNTKAEENWSKYIVSYGNKDIGGFLGMFSGYYPYTNTTLYGAYDETTRYFDFGVENANKYVIISFDFYEIDSWDGEYFRVYINDREIFKKQYYSDTYLPTYGAIEGGEPINIESSMVNGSYGTWYHDEKHTIHYEFIHELDSNGKLRLKLTSTLDEGILNESWGIDNLKVVKESSGEVLSFEDFNSITTNNGWERYITAYGGEDIGNVLGRFTGYYPYTKYTAPNYALYGQIGDYDGTAKNFDFGVENANQDITVSFDFYEIDSWDGEYFRVYGNNKKVLFEKQYYSDTYIPSGNDGGEKVNFKGSSVDGSYANWYHDEKHLVNFPAKLDLNGRIRLEFTSTLNEFIGNESWAIDNLSIKKDSTSEILAFEDFENNIQIEGINKYFICTKTGSGVKSQLYCWGNVGRSLPILNTSLYNTDKIGSINKLFITQESETTKQMAYDNYNNEGNLFLKYPTYISGFDYDFKFK